MRERFGIDRYSLIVQMVLSFVVLVLLTAFAVGLPAILLIRSQVQRQAWAQVDQGSRATQALYAARESNVTHLATLTGDRPTLHALLAQGNQTELTQYVQTLRSDTELDLLLICDNKHQIVAEAGASVTSDVCAVEEAAGFYNLPDTASPQIWLLAAYDINAGAVTEADILGKVVVSIVLDDEFVIQSREQSGLDHTLFSGGQPVASSLPAGVSDRESISGFPAGGRAVSTGKAVTFQINGHPYYAVRIPLEDLGPAHGFELEDEIALAVGDIADTQRNLVWAISASVVVIALVGSALGVFLARRIGRPLAQLAEFQVSP
jgi:hypothetical protein